MKFRQGEMEGGIVPCALLQMAHVDEAEVVIEVMWSAYLRYLVCVPATHFVNGVTQVDAVIVVQETLELFLHSQELIPPCARDPVAADVR